MIRRAFLKTAVGAAVLIGLGAAAQEKVIAKPSWTPRPIWRWDGSKWRRVRMMELRVDDRIALDEAEELLVVASAPVANAGSKGGPEITAVSASEKEQEAYQLARTHQASRQ